MIEVFKTNVLQNQQAEIILTELQDLFPNARINFDLEDCDKILRIQDSDIHAQTIVETLQNRGYSCVVL